MSEQIHVRLDALGRDPHFASGLPVAPRSHAILGDGAPGVVPNGRTFYIETFGCQMNAHDSEKVAGVLLGRGYRMVEKPDAADYIFYNTCSIREKAAQKVFSRLGTLREGQSSVASELAQNAGGAIAPRKVIGVLGCVAQQEGEEIFERAPWVSLVCGSASYRRLPAMIDELEAGNRRVMGLDTDTEETFETEFTRRDNPYRAYLTIIEGCDKKCAFCVVPYTRGPERSRASATVLEDVRRLAGLGYSEIQLLGQTVNSYRDPTSRGMTFAQLLLAVADTPGIRRVRYTTSHPRDFGRDIVEAMDSHPAICEHIHLPVQSGSTRILREMQRTYTREQYLEKIAMIRGARRPMSITSDIIAGFPGETGDDFAETLSLLDIVQYDGLFSFKYSPRPNTPAAHRTDRISEEEQSRRLAVLQERQRQIQTARNEALIGQSFEVLVDSRTRREQWAGRTSGNRMVNFASARENLLGEYLQVQIIRAGPNSLVGELLI